jgi:hypothetical protein
MPSAGDIAAALHPRRRLRLRAGYALFADNVIPLDDKFIASLS